MAVDGNRHVAKVASPSTSKGTCFSWDTLWLGLSARNSVS